MVASVCAKLHNVCIDHSDVVIANRYHRDWQENDIHEIIVNIEHEEDPNVPRVANGQTNGARRRILTDELHRIGVHRPQFAGRNSRA